MHPLLQRALHSIVSGCVILHLHIAAKKHTDHTTDGFQIYDLEKISIKGSRIVSGEVMDLGGRLGSASDKDCLLSRAFCCVGLVEIWMYDSDDKSSAIIAR